MSKARIIDQKAEFYSEMNPQQQPVGSIPVGEVVEIGKIKRRQGRAWVAITRQNGQAGFIPGETHIFHMRRVELDKPTDLYDKTGEGQRVIHQFNKKDRMMMLDVVREGESGWVQVQDFSGHKGFISGKTRIRVLPDDLVAAGRKSMATGSLWATGGLILTVITYLTATTTGGTYIIAWAAVIFGVIQVVQGLMQYYSGRKDEKAQK